MAQFVVKIENVVSGGPYTYVIDKDGVGMKAAVSLASISAALDAVKADIGSNLGAETVTRVTMSVTSA